jgi:serine/threonine protein kinase
MRQGSDQQFYAMKVLEKDKIKRLNLMRYAKIENSVMRTMRHPFIVKLRYSFQTKTGLYLVMRFCPGGDLAKLLDKCDRLSEKDTRICVGEILLAL